MKNLYLVNRLAALNATAADMEEVRELLNLSKLAFQKQLIHYWHKILQAHGMEEVAPLMEQVEILNKEHQEFLTLIEAYIADHNLTK